MQWFRFYSEALDDPKVQRLPGDLFKAWVNLLCLANEQEERGELPDATDIAFRLRLSDDAATTTLNALVQAGLLEIGAAGQLRIHAWDKRQFGSDTSTDRVRKFREKQRETANETERNKSETFQKRSRNAIESDTEADTESEQTQSQKQKQRVRRVPRPLHPTIETFEPDADFLDAMREERPDLHLPSVIDNWRDYHREHASNPKDHTASLRRWIRNEKSGKSARASPVVLENGRVVEASTARKLNLVNGLPFGRS